MSKRQPKSGSKGKSSGKPTPARTFAVPIDSAVREMVRAALGVADGFLETSPLYLQTLMQLFERVITQYGTDVCRALAREKIPRQHETKDRLFIHAALKALAKVGRLDVAKLLLAETGYCVATRIALYASMGNEVPESEKPKVLEIMRSLLRKVDDSAEHMDSLYRIFLHTALPEDHERLRDHALGHIKGKVWLSLHEFEVLFGVASVTQNQDLLVRVIELMASMRLTAQRNGAERRLFDILERSDRESLHELALALAHTCYGQLIQRLAETVRDALPTEPESLLQTS